MQRNSSSIIKFVNLATFSSDITGLMRCQTGAYDDLGEVPTQGIVDDDGATVSEGFYGMTHIAGDDGYHARGDNLGFAVDGYFHLSLDHFINFFLRMEVLVNGGAASEFIMRERHAWRVKIAAMPSPQALDDFEIAGVDERHRTST